MEVTVRADWTGRQLGKLGKLGHWAVSRTVVIGQDSGVMTLLSFKPLIKLSTGLMAAQSAPDSITLIQQR